MDWSRHYWHKLNCTLICPWTADWSTCQLSENAICGQGFHLRFLDCIRSDGKIMELQNCQQVTIAIQEITMPNVLKLNIFFESNYVKIINFSSSALVFTPPCINKQSDREQDPPLFYCHDSVINKTCMGLRSCCRLCLTPFSVAGIKLISATCSWLLVYSNHVKTVAIESFMGMKTVMYLLLF